MILIVIFLSKITELLNEMIKKNMNYLLLLSRQANVQEALYDVNKPKVHCIS